MDEGNGPFQFGKYEWLKTLHWKTLVAAVTVAAGLWVSAELVPAMQAQGGYLAGVGAILAVLTAAVVQWARDNTGQSL